MRNNAQGDPDPDSVENEKNSEISKLFNPKSTWKPSPPDKTLDTF